MKLPKGMKIKDLVIGDGSLAIKGNIATIEYKCFLPRGEILSSSENEVIVGQRGECTFLAFSYGLLGMAEGGIRNVIVSPNLTYFEKMFYPNLPANTTLLYEIKLIKISERSLPPPKLKMPFKEESVSQLLARLSQQSENPWLPIQELARRKGTEVEKEILKLLNSSDPLVRSYLIERLSIENNLSPYLSKVQSCLLDSNPYVVIRACEALSKIRYTDCADLLLKVLTRSEPNVLCAALEAVISLSVECPLSLFFKILNRTNSPDLKKILCKAMLTRASQDNWLEIFTLFLKFEATFRIKACKLFLQYGSIFELDLLTTLKQDIDPHVRSAAFRAISHIEKKHY